MKTASPEPKRSFVCVECGASVPFLVREFGRGNLRLAICDVCNEVADKYVEYENVLLLLEVMLLKPQVYRHVLYNLSSPMEPRTLLKMFVILVMLDVNIKAQLIDGDHGVLLRSTFDYAESSASFRLLQLLHLVALALVENVAYFGGVLWLMALDPFARGWRHTLQQHNGEDPKSYAVLPQYVSAMCISSFGKMFALLTVIWDYHWTFVHVIGLIVFQSNVLALQLFLEPSTDPAKTTSKPIVALVVLSLMLRFGVQLVLFAAGNPMLFFVCA